MLLSAIVSEPVRLGRRRLSVDTFRRHAYAGAVPLPHSAIPFQNNSPWGREGVSLLIRGLFLVTVVSFPIQKGDYSLSWYYDDLSSDVVFKLSAKSPFTNFWTGVLLGEDKPVSPKYPRFAHFAHRLTPLVCLSGADSWD